MLFLLENGSLDQSSIVIHIQELLKETRKKKLFDHFIHFEQYLLSFSYNKYRNRRKDHFLLVHEMYTKKA